MVAVLAMAVAIFARSVLTDPADGVIYHEMGDALGVDFGDWPDFFYTGAKGDGRVFAVMAVDPFGSGPSLTILSVVYRFSRIGMPVLVWVASFGQESLVLPVIAVIGLVSVAAMGFLAGFMRNQLGWRSWFLVANPALFIGFQGGTAEPFALLILVATFISGSRILAAALGITRPSYAIALFGKWALLSWAVAAAFVLRIAVYWRFRGSLLGGPEDLFASPLSGYISANSWDAWLIGAIASLTLIMGIRARTWSWAASGFFVLCFGIAILAEPVNAIRAAGFLPVLWAFGPNPQWSSIRRCFGSSPPVLGA
jgi:hypothetical protein